MVHSLYCRRFTRIRKVVQVVVLIQIVVMRRYKFMSVIVIIDYLSIVDSSKTDLGDRNDFELFPMRRLCPPWVKYGRGPPSQCLPAVDPLRKPKSRLESWFTMDMFGDLFPKANLGWGPHECSPYNYDSFVIAARYFPHFGTEEGQTFFLVSPNNTSKKYPSSDKDDRNSTENSDDAEEVARKLPLKPGDNPKRDLAAFFAHAVQETGENDASLYDSEIRNKSLADECFYRGGFFNWFEGGPVSSFLPSSNPGLSPEEGERCSLAGRYCVAGADYDAFFPCNTEQKFSSKNYSSAGDGGGKTDEFIYKGCYFGRGAIQISYNYNYGQFQQFLFEQGLDVDLLNEPNLLITKRDPPLAIMASLWFYMTPQPPKPAMHDIIIGKWNAGVANDAAGYAGPILGPTSLVINNECGGEDDREPGGPGESRRIKAFKFFCKYFDVPTGPETTLSCKKMPVSLEQIPHNVSWQPDWSTAWKSAPCRCAPATYGGLIPYYQKKFYPEKFIKSNFYNERLCLRMLYGQPDLYALNSNTSDCLNYPLTFEHYGHDYEKIRRLDDELIDSESTRKFNFEE